MHKGNATSVMHSIESLLKLLCYPSTTTPNALHYKCLLFTWSHSTSTPPSLSLSFLCNVLCIEKILTEYLNKKHFKVDESECYNWEEREGKKLCYVDFFHALVVQIIIIRSHKRWFVDKHICHDWKYSKHNIVGIDYREKYFNFKTCIKIFQIKFIVFYWKTLFARKFVVSSLSSLIEAAKASTTCHEHQIKREKNMCTVGNDEIHKKPFAN